MSPAPGQHWLESRRKENLYRFACRREDLAIRAQFQRSQWSDVSGYNADVPCVDLDHLDLPRRSTREDHIFRAKTAQAEEVVCSFEHEILVWWGGKSMDMDAILESHNDSRAGQPDAIHRCAELQGKNGLLLDIVPYYGLPWSESIARRRGLDIAP